MAQIKWVTSFQEGLSQAKIENKLVFLDFFNPGCIGCKQMTSVAYPDPAVIDFITGNFIPVRIPADDTELGPRFSTRWTPALLVIDAEGNEHYRTLGFYPPKDLIPSLLLGMGIAKFNQPDRPAACNCFGKIIADYPGSSIVPEAVYLNGVSR